MKYILQKLPWDFILVIPILFTWVFYPTASLMLCLLLLGIWIIGYLKTGFLLSVTPYNLPFTFLALLTGMSVFVTPDITFSAGKITGVIVGLLTFYAILRWYDEACQSKQITGRQGSLLSYVIFCFVSIGGAVALLGILGADWFQKYPLLTRLSSRIPQIIPDLPGMTDGFQPNAISGTLTLITPLTLIVGWQVFIRNPSEWLKSLHPLPIRFVKSTLALVLILQGTWWVLAQTRGAWLGLFCGILFLGLLLVKPGWARISWIIPLLIVFVVYLYWFRMEDFNVGSVNLETLGGDFLISNLAFRFQVWRWAVLVLKRFPYTGVGLNIFREIAPFLFFGLRSVDIAHAHNIWLNVGVSFGWGGIIVYVYIWGLTISLLISKWLTDHDQTSGRFAASLAAGWYAYFIFGLADVIPLGSKLGIILFLDLAVCYLITREGWFLDIEYG